MIAPLTLERKRRILFVIDDMDVGGTQKQVCEVISRLDSSMFVSDLVCLERGGAALERTTGMRNAVVLGARRVFDHVGLAAAVRLARIMRQGRYDVVEAYLPWAHFLCTLAAQTARRGAVVAARRHLAHHDPGWFAAAQGLVNRATHFSIANSDSVKQSLVDRYHLSPSKIAVVANLADTAMGGMTRETARLGLNLPSAAFVVAAAGTLCPVKDYPTILRAFSMLATSATENVLVIAGDGPDMVRLKALACTLGVSGRVRFLGSVRDVSQVLAAADVLIHASRSEGSSNTVLEAMSASLPIVASDIAANREVLGGDAALYFQPGDSRQCAAAIATLASDPTSACLAGKSLRLRVSALFDSESLMRRREKLYRRIGETVNGPH